MKLRRFDSFSRLEREALALLTEALTAPAVEPQAVVLPGGETPLGLYRHLEKRPFTADASVHVILSDERYVTTESPESNYGNLQGMLRALGIGPDRVLRVRTELPLMEAAMRYDAELRSFFEGGGRLSLALLGLGEDGHVASLFRPEDVRAGRDRFAVAVPRERGLDRISVTADALARAERAVFLAHGRAKAGIVDRLVNRPETIAAGLAVQGIGDVEVWYAPE